MNPITYIVLGADRQQSNPVDVATLQTWINESRVLGNQLVFRSDQKDWIRADQFEELAWPGGAPALRSQSDHASSRPGGTDADRRAVAEASSWPYWIGGLSLVNFLMAAFGSDGGFVLGSAVASMLGILAYKAGHLSAGGIAAWGGALAICGGWALLGFFCGRIHRWAFIVASIATLLGGLFAAAGEMWLGALFHGWALWRLVAGTIGAFRIRRSA